MPRILVTRPRAQSDQFVADLRAAGYEPVLFPVIQISPLEDTTLLDRALRDLHCYTWLVLTSVNAVKVIGERLKALRIEQLPHSLRLAAIGPKTAESMQTYGLNADFVPPEYVAEAILPGLGDLRGCWVLLPRADLARPDLPRLIQQADGIAHEVVAYRTLPAEPDPQGLHLLRKGVQVVTFTSSSTVRNFTALLRSAGLDPLHLPGDPLFACIGPVTAATAQEHGYPVAVVAQEYTTQGLLQAIASLHLN